MQDQQVQPEPRETLINFVLDETGSMLEVKDQTIRGFNEYIKTLQNQRNGLCLLSLTKFNSDKVEVVYVAKPVGEVELLTANTYQPAQLTPLYDAVGQTIRAAEQKARREQNVLVVIMTDGEENDSKEFTREGIFQMIKEKQEKHNWTFVYLGAVQDAWLVGQKLGLHRGNVIAYARAKTGEAMAFAGQSSALYCGYDAVANGPQKRFFVDREQKEKKLTSTTDDKKDG